jgi:phosphoribosylaminoimidazole carboxylase PurE protein
MKPLVSIIMGSTSDLPVMEKAAEFFDKMEIPFEMLALSAHRTPRQVEEFASQAKERGITAVNGLEMLVAQAKYAVELFLDTEIPDERIDEITNLLSVPQK